MTDMSNYTESGYRINFSSLTLAMNSLLQWHNETVNVWTHLFGCLAFVALTAYVICLPHLYQSQNQVPIWPLIVHCLAAFIQMGASFQFHLFNCQSCHAFSRLQKFDYAGIALMIAGTVTAPFYYGFQGHQKWVFIGLVYFCCGLALAVVLIP